MGVTHASPEAAAAPLKPGEAMGIGDAAVSSQVFSISADPRRFRGLPARKGLKIFLGVGEIFKLTLVPLFPCPSCVILPLMVHALVNKKH